LLYLSAYFERNKSHYYDNLTRVREKSDILHWLKYFLIGVEQTAGNAVQTLSEVIKLKQRLEADIHNHWGRRTQSALKLLNHLFLQPVVSVKRVQGITQLSKKAAGDLVESFEKAEILKEQTGFERNRIFTFQHYLSLFETGK
jgi:Fic family protein